MKTTLTFYKNSNTGRLVMKQHFEESYLTDPTFFYDKNRKSIATPDLKGFVEITEKKFNRESKNKNK